ncbi:MAG: polysaccharide biosynthesis tyrosine autokinase [Ghiorsea sp.]|nr:polysaccharide biosynthesis tyrosine autokinase [Ghiorsea sp.]
MQNSEQNVQMKQVIDEDEIDLSEYLTILLDAKWFILAFGLSIMLISAVYALSIQPVFQADALLQVEQKKPNIAGGDLMSIMGGGDASASTEIEIIRSRSVIGTVVEKLELSIYAKANVFPVIGGYFLRTYAQDGLREPLFGFNSYAWGGEKIKVESLFVTSEYVNQVFTLQAQGQGSYAVYAEDTLLFKGQVGQLASSVDGKVKLYVSELLADEGTLFTVAKLRKADVIGSTLSSLSISEKGKGTGIINLFFSSTSPALAKEVVDTVAQVYLRQNVERKSEEAKRSLAFLREQLPQVRGQLEAAETHMNEYRLKSGSVDLNLETQAVLKKVVGLEQQLSELDMKKTDLSQRFTANHPLMLALDEKYRRLQLGKKEIEEKVKTLPDTEQKLLSLMRNVKVNTELYTFMLNKVQELKVVEASTVGNVRILDLAMLPYSPIKPKKSLIVLLGLFIGLFLGIVISFVRKAMNQGIEDPALVESKLGISVFAAIPHSVLQEKLHQAMRNDKGKSGKSLLAEVDSTDLAIEALRNLRTNLHFALLEAKSNIVMLTGPAPGLGKSFISANFAAVLASSGKKVVVIDADMRKGHLHEYFGIPRTPGLSGYISGNVSLDDAIHATPVQNLSVIPTGIIPPNPADLLMHERFDELLSLLSERFDLVLIDTPPVLAVTDAVLVGRRAGISFMLLRSGRHPLREIEQAVKQVEQAGISLAGFVFNDVMPKRSGYGYGAYHYQYSYK